MSSADNRKFNLGLALLRALMCFEIILIHCGPSQMNDSNVLHILKPWAAPVFMMLSFFLTHTFFVEHKKDKVINRTEKLLIPQFGYAIIYYVIYKLLNILFGAGLNVDIEQMFIQMITGHSYELNPTMWFQTDLIILTIIFLIVIHVFKEKYEYILVILSLLAIFIQYSGINNVFMSMSYPIRYPVGRLSEMLPLAVAGFVLAKSKFLDKLKENRYLSLTVILVGILLYSKYEFFEEIEGYGYAGIGLIFISIFVIAFAYLLPLDKVSDRIYNVMTNLTRYTLGIYCMHRMISKTIDSIAIRFGIKIDTHTILACLVIYVIGYVISLLGTLAAGKTKLSSMFN